MEKRKSLILVDAMVQQYILSLPVLQMAIGGTEWIIIILMGLFLLFGSKKLPGNIKNIGEGNGEYDKARELFRREMENATRIAEEPKSYLMGPKITRRLVQNARN